MRPVEVELRTLVDDRRQGPRLAPLLRGSWPLLAIAALLSIGAAGRWTADRDRQEAQSLIARLYESQAPASEPAPKPVAVAAATAPELAAETLAWARAAKFPVQGVLQSLESVRLSGARLRSVAIDAQASTVVATFALGSAEQGLQVLDHLNAGQVPPPWRLRELRGSAGAFDGVFECTLPAP